MKHLMKIQLILMAAFAMIAAQNLQAQGGAERAEDAIWAHGELYDTVGTPTAFKKAPEHSTDVIYSFGMSGLEGQRSIAASAPGDRDYNGGRWSVKLAVFTEQGLEVHDPDGDGAVDFELTGEMALIEHVLLGHLEIVDTTVRFERPMIPNRRP
jgi:hypothetical protein